MWVCCIVGPWWRSHVPSCLAWASAAHKHSGASSAPGYVDGEGGWRQETWFQSLGKATPEKASMQEDFGGGGQREALWRILLNLILPQNLFLWNSAAAWLCLCVLKQWFSVLSLRRFHGGWKLAIAQVLALFVEHSKTIYSSTKMLLHDNKL